jgi:integrase
VPLSNFAITKASPGTKAYKLADGFGLHLLVKPNGAKLWRFRYRFGGSENMLALGVYPTISLADARTKRDEARKLLANGVDPSVKRKQDKIAAAVSANNTFGLIAAELLANKEETKAAPATIAKNKWLIENLAAPLADRPIAEITAAEILHLLKHVEKSGRRETARRLRGIIGSVFRYAIVTLRATGDPTTATHGALLPPDVQHRAAITDEKKLGGLLRGIDEYDGWPTLKAALQFLALTFARPGEVRAAKRIEFDFKNAVWHIAGDRTKMRRPHSVPLSPQAIAVVQDVWELSEHSEYVFPSIRSHRRPLSENALNAALRRMGVAAEEMTAHGFRSSASTILNSRGFNSDVIEAQLAHQDQNEVRRAYNRAKYWPERVALMNEWAILLDSFRLLAQ